MSAEVTHNQPFIPPFISNFIQRRPAIIALLVLTLLCALFFWRFLTPTDADRQIIPEGDFTVQFYANADYQVERLQNGEIPLWNPYNYAGEPFFANWQLAAWYPPRWIASALWGSSDGWGLDDFMREVMAHYWLTSIFTYAFLFALTKKHLPAVAGSLVFTYGGYLTSYPMQQVAILEGATWLPLTLLGVHLSITQPRWRIRGMILSAIAIALVVLAGHPQTIMQVGYMTLLYLMYLIWQHKLNFIALLWRIGLLGILGVGIAMIQLIPALEFTLQSARLDTFAYTEKSAGLEVSSLPQIIFPTLFGVWSPLYIGMVGLLLSLTTFIKPTAKHIFWIGIIVLSILLGLGRETIIFDAFYVVIPGFSLFRQQERIVLLIAFATAVLTAYQLSALSIELTFKNLKRATLILLGLTALVMVAVLVVGIVDDSPINPNTDVVTFTVLILILLVAGLYWSKGHGQVFIGVMLIAIIVIDLFTINTRSANFVPDVAENQHYLPEAVQAYQIDDHDLQWRVDGASGVRGYGTLFRIPDMYGVAPVFLESMEELRRIPVDRFWELFSVRYITAVDAPPEHVPLELLAYDLNTVGQEYQVFELQDPRPMAHLVYDYRHGEGSPEFARQIMADSRVNLREMAVTTDPLEFDLSGERPANASVTEFQWDSPESVSMRISSSESALLTISIPNYPGWRATVNGERVDIIDVYTGLIGIPITPAENQDVLLEFVPDSVIFGAVISGVALLISIGLFIFEVAYKIHEYMLDT